MGPVCPGLKRPSNQVRRGPALGEQDLRISDEKSQIALDVPLLSLQSVRCVPQVHGWKELAKCPIQLSYLGAKSSKRDGSGEVHHKVIIINLQLSTTLYTAACVTYYVTHS